MTLINVKTKQDLIKLKKNLIKRAEEEKLKDFNQDANLEKLYKPIVEPLKQIVSETKETKKSIEGINGIPAILEKRPEPLAIKDVPISLQNFGPIATKYLTHIFSKKGDHDTTYGLKLDEESKAFRLGRENVMIEGDNIIIGDYEYQLNDDLWKLLTLKDAGKFEDYTADVKHAYIDIMNKTKAYLNEKGKLHIAPRSKKYNNVIKPTVIAFNKIEHKRHAEKIRQTRVEQERRRSNSISDPSGSGVIIIPSDINELVERHQLLLAGYKAGNTGVFNEIQAINNRLLNEGIFDNDDLINFSTIFF